MTDYTQDAPAVETPLASAQAAAAVAVQSLASLVVQAAMPILLDELTIQSDQFNRTIATQHETIELLRRRLDAEAEARAMQNRTINNLTDSLRDLAARVDTNEQRINLVAVKANRMEGLISEDRRYMGELRAAVNGNADLLEGALAEIDQHQTAINGNADLLEGALITLDDISKGFFGQHDNPSPEGVKMSSGLLSDLRAFAEEHRDRLDQLDQDIAVLGATATRAESAVNSNAKTIDFNCDLLEQALDRLEETQAEQKAAIERLDQVLFRHNYEIGAMLQGNLNRATELSRLHEKNRQIEQELTLAASLVEAAFVIAEQHSDRLALLEPDVKALWYANNERLVECAELIVRADDAAEAQTDLDSRLLDVEAELWPDTFEKISGSAHMTVVDSPADWLDSELLRYLETGQRPAPVDSGSMAPSVTIDFSSVSSISSSVYPIPSASQVEPEDEPVYGPAGLMFYVPGSLGSSVALPAAPGWLGNLYINLFNDEPAEVEPAPALADTFTSISGNTSVQASGGIIRASYDGGVTWENINPVNWTFNEPAPAPEPEPACPFGFPFCTCKGVL